MLLYALGHGKDLRYQPFGRRMGLSTRLPTRTAQDREDACPRLARRLEKYIYHFGEQPEELFDLSQGPFEERNLADERSREELDEWREELFVWSTRVNAQYGRILVNGNPLLGEE